MQERPTSQYLVGLLFDQPPVLDGEALLAGLKRRFPGMSRLGELQFALSPEAPEWEGVELPCTNWVVLPTETPPEPAKLVKSAEQTWDWPQAKEVLQRCRYKLLAGDMMGTPLAPKARLTLLHGFLREVVAQARPLAIEWLPSERFVDPARYLATTDDDVAFATAALNVRMFKVGDGEDETVMDTRGLAELGLPDVQCRFQELNTSGVAVRLASTAHLIFEKGDIIKDGDTIDGLPEGTHWSCKHAESLVAPAREVLDVGQPRGMSMEEAEITLDSIADVKGGVDPELRARVLDSRTSDEERAKLVQEAFSWAFAGDILAAVNQRRQAPAHDPFAPQADWVDPVAELEERRKKETESTAKVMLVVALVVAVLLVVLRFLR